MAEDKSSFLLYCDQIGMFEKLPDDVAGRLIKHIYRYTNDLNPKTDELIVDALFEPIKQQLKRDLKKYRGVVEEKSIGGKIGNLKRWHKDIYKEFIDKKISLDDALLKAKDRISSDTDRMPSHPIAKIADTVTVTDTVNDKEILYLSIWENFPYKTEFKKSLNLFDEKFRPTTPSQKIDWLDVFEKTVRIDKYSPEKIVELITWAREDSFWKSNLMSLASLRKKGPSKIKKIDSINAKFSSEKNTSSKQEKSSSEKREDYSTKKYSTKL